MKTMTATEVVRNFSAILSRLETGAEEITIVRNKHPVAKLVPGAPVMRAMDAFADLYGVLSDDEGAAWLKDAAGADRPLGEEMGDPWA